MKRILLIICLVFTIVISEVNAQDTYINNNGILMNDNEIKNLKNLGFTDEEIEKMDYNEFVENKDIESLLIKTEIKYIKSVYTYRIKNTLNLYEKNDDLNLDNYEISNIINYEITEQEYNSFPSESVITYDYLRDVNPDIHETNAKKLTTTISYISSSNQYRLKNVLKWKTVPVVRSNDLFGIGGPSATQIPVSGTQHASGTWTEYDHCRSISTQQSANYASSGRWFLQGGGYAVLFGIPKDYYENVVWNYYYGNLPYPCNDIPVNQLPPQGSASKLHSMSNMVFTFYYNVAKQNLGSTVNAFGSYQHTVQNLALNANIGLSIGTTGLGGAFSVSPSYVSYFDGMAGTHAQILNPVW